MDLMRNSRLAALLAAVTLAAACGGADVGSTDQPSADVITVSERTSPSADSRVAGAAVTSFGLDLFAAARSADPQGNVTLSPTSVAIALAMTEPGTVDDAQQQLRSTLRIDDPTAFHSSMNALEQDLEARTPDDFGEDNDPGELTIAVANAAYLQAGYPFEADYLDTVGTNYRPVLRQVDFAADPDAVAGEINDFIAEATRDQIVDLIADGTLQPDTVLALVNALYLKASWLETFDEAATADAGFTLLDGSQVDIDMMKGGGDSSAAGDGWVAATKNYVGGLSAEFILPDDGRFDEIATTLPTVLQDIERNRTSGADLAVPRFETRTTTELSSALRAMGLTAPFAPGGLLGMADDSDLIVDQIVHESFVAMDEDGTEAAAATVVLARAVSGPITEPVSVTLDRPFIYRIIDNSSGATLFIGQVTNPTE